MIVRQIKNPLRAALLGTALLAFAAPAKAAQDIAKRLAEALAANDSAAVSTLLAEDFKDQSEDFLGQGGLLLQLDQFRTALPEAAVDYRVVKSPDGVIAIERTLRGVATAPLFGEAPPPAPLTIKTMDFFTVKGGRVATREGVVDTVGALQQLTFPFPAPAPKQQSTVEEVVRFQPGQFPEGLIPGENGSVLLTMLFDNKILSISADGKITPYAELPFPSDPKTRQGTMCIARAPDGAIFITVHSKTPEAHGLWRLDPDGSARNVAVLPQDAVPNGVDVDEKGRVYVADSSGGVWQWRPGDESAAKWLDTPIVNRRPFIGNLPGPNGLKVHKKWVYVAVSDTSSFVRIPIGKKGESGNAELVAHGAPGDDFDFDRNDAAYITTHPFNSVLKVTDKGVESVIANAEDGVIGPTSAAIVDTDNGTALYVVTDGGLYAPVPGVDIVPRLMRIPLD